MADYVICKENNTDMFIKACETIEQVFPNAKKERLLIDVDGSTIQIYMEKGEKITIFDDYDIGTVFATSNLDLKNIFS